MRALSVMILLVALVLPSGHASASPSIDISVEELQTLHTQATQGHTKAQHNLGVLYAYGDGVPPDDVRVHMWLTLAAAHSTGDLQKYVVINRGYVARRMTPAQIAEAHRLSQECEAQQFKGC